MAEKHHVTIGRGHTAVPYSGAASKHVGETQ